MFDITVFIHIAILAITAVCVLIAMPRIKKVLDAKERKRIKEYIDVFVQAAEQLFPSVDGEEMGKEKLNYVANQLEKHGITFDVDDVYDDIRTMIETAVKEFTE